jgi:transcriptional regulator with XRE-family HTH domain
MPRELYAVIRFLWPKHTLNQAILSEVKAISGKDVILLWAVEKWKAAFDGRRIEFITLPSSGRPRDTGKVDAIRARIEDERYLSQKKIAQILGIHHETVKRILRDGTNMRKVNFKWVSHALNSFPKAVRVQISREPLHFMESRTNCSLSNVYTGDETGVCLYHLWMSMWIGADITRPARVRRTVALKKRLF